MLLRKPRTRSPRRGVTLVEMLVAVALLVLMMTVIVQVFSAATGAVSAAKTFQELDNSLRQVDITLRQDFANVTARFTPPLDPKNNLGYFEYGENSFADLQGEDTDDYVRFTVKAPEGQSFTGRAWAPLLTGYWGGNPPAAAYNRYYGSQPLTVTSQYAEVIYFLRNGNLYRRVLLVRPELQNTIPQPVVSGGGAVILPYLPVGTFGLPRYAVGGGTFPGSQGVSWQGANDLSARPSPTNPVPGSAIVLNTLGDLTNRENRFAYPRFCNNFVVNSNGSLNTLGGPNYDFVPDDQDDDTVPDYYPTLYPNVFSVTRPNTTIPLVQDFSSRGGTARTAVRGFANASTMAFPYVFPGAYSVAEPYSFNNGLGTIHTPNPGASQTTRTGLQLLNHAPLDIGDNLPLPAAATSYQTWWGFPTWRETMMPSWGDPAVVLPLSGTSAQSPGLFAGTLPLPPMDNRVFPTTANGSGSPLRVNPQLFSDGAGTLALAQVSTPQYPTTDFLWQQVWEDDLILSGVRSFDIKAYDDLFPGYVDLGWGDDLRNYPDPTVDALAPTFPPFLAGTPSSFTWPFRSSKASDNFGSLAAVNAGVVNRSFAHEGRIPPLTADLRADPQWPLWNPNVGDDTGSTLRIRRVWDSWSTDYSAAPWSGVQPTGKFAGIPLGPPFSPPVYPSYPPPYPAPLRGIQVQIRVVDPRGERLKVLTIRQDFSDKL